MNKELGIVSPSDLDIDTVYNCPKCGGLYTVIDRKIVPEHRIPGWIIHKGMALIMKCLKCEEKSE